MKESSLYIHIPYCESKCIYCDFYSGGSSAARWEVLTDSLLREFKERKTELPDEPDTLYIGGGTPSLMPLEKLERLVEEINRYFGKDNRWKEFTIEVNPDDVTEDKCLGWGKIGVNRVSMGVQSFNDDELRTLKRRHNSEMALLAFRLLRTHFTNISIDLMFGIPGQTLESWEKSVEMAISLLPEHISAYSLMLEEGTALTFLYNKGRVELPSEEDCNSMWELLSNKLRKVGYDQYEISNYSLPGFRSVHNSRYWSGNPYLGLGPSAHSYDGNNIRRYNPPLLKEYLSFFSEYKARVNDQHFYDEEILNKEELMEEKILTRIRVREGISLKEFKDEFGENEVNRLLKNAESLLTAGKIKIEDNFLSLTTQGIMTSNQVILSLSM
ncbi:MAG: radical SAM family heme chaperone HemW [Bacteroides sp.]|nr:radical SAM family heme chaperone HemW [Bacteroides sp.]